MKHTLLAAAMAAAITAPSAFAGHVPVTPTTPAVDVRGVDHVGINVPDVEAATAFFADTFGFAPVTEMRDIPVDAAFKTTFHMHADTHVKSIRMMRAGDGSNIELFEYASTTASKVQPYMDDLGAAHIAFYTDDIDKAVAALRARGVKVLTDPIRMTQGATAGNAWVYFETPWGAKMELVSYPNGQAGETAGVRLWKAPGNAGNAPMDRASVERLVASYVGMLNEHDAKRRARTIDACYTDDTTFNDPEGMIRGKQQLNALVGTLQSRNPGFVFRQDGPLTIQNDSVRVHWAYGPARQPAVITGEDILTVAGGRIATTTVFLNTVPNQ